LLEVRNLSARYGAVRALQGVGLAVSEGEIVCIIGANGAGKTTLLNVISGVHPPQEGEISWQGRPLPVQRPERVVARGVVQVPEGRQVFAPLSVRENLELGAFLRWKKQRRQVEEDLERVFAMFPVLKKRQNQRAGTLSGGEQQMLALGRGLMAAPRLLLLDEPSLGLAPLVVREIFKAIHRLPEQGCAVLVVEQNAKVALKVSHRGYVMAGGRITLAGSARELAENPQVQEAFLGKKQKPRIQRAGDRA